MAQAGVGVGMLEVSRMRRALVARPSLRDYLFAPEEQTFCNNTARPAEHYAMHFAARLAVLKALGTTFSDGVEPSSIVVLQDEKGFPRVQLSGQAEEIAQKKGVREIALSLSATDDVAVANAVAVTDDVRPRLERKQDQAERLRASFRDARSVIDELDRLETGVPGAIGTISATSGADLPENADTSASTQEGPKA